MQHSIVGIQLPNSHFLTPNLHSDQRQEGLDVVQQMPVIKDRTNVWFFSFLVNALMLLLSPPALCPALFLLPFGRPIVKWLLAVGNGIVAQLSLMLMCYMGS
jgi:hypothetical protein